MIVYANTLRVIGNEPDQPVLRAIHGWLKEKLDRDIQFADIFSRRTISGGRRGFPVSVQGFLADREFPKYYAWRVSHPDSQNHARRWTVELGIEQHDDELSFSCVVVVEDRSPMVEATVEPSRPRIVGYVQNNVTGAPNVSFHGDTPGLKVSEVNGDPHEFIALRDEVLRPERNFPLVLISPLSHGGYVINPAELQDRLIGIAQVVQIAPNCDTFEMAEYLTSRWTAWDGAVNIIYGHNGYSEPRYRKFVESELWRLEEHSRRRDLIFGWVTDTTNLPNKRHAVTPDRVLRVSLKRRLEARVEQYEKNTASAEDLRAENEESRELMQEYEAENERLEEELHRQQSLTAQHQEEVEQLRQQVGRFRQTNEHLKASLKKKNPNSRDSTLDTTVIELVSSNKPPTPEQTLELVKSCYGNQVVILESAWKSARESEVFKYGARLLRLMRTLVEEYLPKLLEKGDAQARACLGKNYAAHESQTTSGRKEYREARTFEYNGEPLLMEQHLKIGAADDLSETIRVHFHIDIDNEMVVIGYCGPHLPIGG